MRACECVRVCTVSHVVDAVQVTLAFLVIHVLTFGLYYLYGILAEEDLTGRPAEELELNYILNQMLINLQLTFTNAPRATSGLNASVLPKALNASRADPSPALINVFINDVFPMRSRSQTLRAAPSCLKKFFCAKFNCAHLNERAAAAAFTDLRSSPHRRKLNSPDVFLSQEYRLGFVQFLRRHPGERANTHLNTHTHTRARLLTHASVLSPARAPSAAPGLSWLLYTHARRHTHTAAAFCSPVIH